MHRVARCTGLTPAGGLSSIRMGQAGVQATRARAFPAPASLAAPTPQVLRGASRHTPLNNAVALSSSFTPHPSLEPEEFPASTAAGTGGALPSLDFDDVSESFAVKTELDMWRSLLVFKLCAIKPLVSNARQMLLLSEKLLGRHLTHWVLRQTFFGHFCAGETEAEVAQVINKLEASGIGGILDYAAEADVAAHAPPESKPAAPGATATPGPAVPGTGAPTETAEALEPTPFPRDRTGILSARTYDYASEADCDANAEICAQCIEAAGAKGDGQGFAAIKLTALGKPELLEHLSKILDKTKKMFVAFTQIEQERISASAAAVGAHDGQSSELPQLSFPRFQEGLRAINVHLDPTRARKLFDRIDQDKSNSIDVLEWVSFLDPRQLGGLSPKFRSEGLPTLSQGELDKVNAMVARLEKLAELAAAQKVRLMVDAEQTYFQPAIDHLVLHLQRKYNGGKDGPVIFNTYQCYLRDCRSRVLLDLERSKREGFVFAAKVVRGAYMVQERRRAAEMGYDDPIQPNIQATHDSYQNIVSLLLHHSPQAHVLVATHNEYSVRFVTELMEKLGRPRSGSGVFFGQLLGMCDHVSFSLGRCGFQSYKYVPYGPIHDVIPYLVRRAEENSDMLGGATKERELLWQEIKRRYKVKLGLIKPGTKASLAH